MSRPQHNLVQVEFFHVGGKDTSSLEVLFREIGERVEDGLEMVLRGRESRSHIKTVVRFFDETGTLTKIALRAERLKTRYEKLLVNFVGSTALWRWLLNIQSRRLARKILALKQEIEMLASASLQRAIRASREVAIERLDHSFRLVKKNEGHELVESTRNPKSVWLFVFQPNGLLSDSNTIVTCIM